MYLYSFALGKASTILDSSSTVIELYSETYPKTKTINTIIDLFRTRSRLGVSLLEQWRRHLGLRGIRKAAGSELSWFHFHIVRNGKKCGRLSFNISMCLLQILHETFAPQGLLLTAAVSGPPTITRVSYNVAALNKWVRKLKSTSEKNKTALKNN